MVADFRRRFWVSLILSVPVLALSPLIQAWLGLGEALAFPGDRSVQAALATVIYFYGGWPFLRGVIGELRQRQPEMMTLIALAITVAWGYSALVALGLHGEVFFWELATLIDVMLLGHWIEMKSVLGASAALESLVRLLPAEAHLVGAGGATRDVPVAELKHGDRVLIKPGEKVPTDGTIVEGERRQGWPWCWRTWASLGRSPACPGRHSHSRSACALDYSHLSSAPGPYANRGAVNPCQLAALVDDRPTLATAPFTSRPDEFGTAGRAGS
jgi:hypothetical protein